MSRVRQTNQQKAGKQFSADTTQAAYYGSAKDSKSKKKARKSKRGY